MIVLVFGANGQVGRELFRALTAIGAVVAVTRTGALDGADCEQADLTAPSTLRSLLDRVQPELVINAAAYTAVDRAEGDGEIARLVNSVAPAEIATWCAARGARFIHYSTDYVFDGTSVRAYREDDAVAPVNMYGATKLAGENAIREVGGRYSIIRTSGVYSRHGRNFVRTILELARRGAPIRVVGDQFTAPTPASLVADTTVRMILAPHERPGTWHLTPSGHASWFEFAEAILDEALAAGILASRPEVESIPSENYFTAARRPTWSVLDNGKVQAEFGVVFPGWRQALRREFIQPVC